MSDSTFVSFPDLGIDTFEMKKNVVEDLFGTGLTIAWYGLLITLGIIIACVIAGYNATKKEGFKLDSYLDYALAGIPASIVGARLMYVIFMIKDYIVYDADGSFALGATLKKMVSVWEGGLAVYGGVIFGFLAVWIVAKKKKQSILQVLDPIIPGLMIAQAIGRWGNFVNGEAYGYETSLPWGMKVASTAEGMRLAKACHPTFFYESLWNFIGFLLVMLLLYRVGKKKYHGEILAFYMIWYGAGRAVVEGMRTDSLYIGPEDWGIRVSQVIGIVSVLAGAFLLYWVSRHRPVKAAEAETKEDLPIETITMNDDAASGEESGEKTGEAEEKTEEKPEEPEEKPEETGEKPEEPETKEEKADEKENG